MDSHMMNHFCNWNHTYKTDDRGINYWLTISNNKKGYPTHRYVRLCMREKEWVILFNAIILENVCSININTD